MFVLVNDRPVIDELLKRPIVSILRSLNVSRIAKPSGEVSDAGVAYVIEIEEKGDRVGLFVCLYLIRENQLLFYRHDSAVAFPMNDIERIEDEARSFVESMGFSMSDLRFQVLSPEKQIKVQKVLPFFFQTPELFLKRFLLGYDDEIRHEFGDFIREVNTIHGQIPKTDDERVIEGVAAVLSAY